MIYALKVQVYHTLVKYKNPILVIMNSEIQLKSYLGFKIYI